VLYLGGRGGSAVWCCGEAECGSADGQTVPDHGQAEEVDAFTVKEERAGREEVGRGGRGAGKRVHRSVVAGLACGWCEGNVDTPLADLRASFLPWTTCTRPSTLHSNRGAPTLRTAARR